MKDFFETDLIRKENARTSLRFHGGALPYFSFPAFDDAGLVNAFTTKKGGISTGVYAELDLGFTKEPMEIVRENYRLTAERLGVDPLKIVSSYQTHTTNVRLMTAEDAGKGAFLERDYIDVDGMVTDVAGRTLSTLYADCVPLYFYDEAHHAIGLSHSGWKGTVGRIGAATVRKMQECFGTDPAQLIAAVGPSICADCYEVSEDVAEAFRAAFDAEDLEAILRPGKAPGKYQLDLWEANRRVLIEAGIPGERISVTDICTKCNSDLLYSHRAMGPERGLQAAFLGIPVETVREHQHSCGAVIFRDSGESREFLLVRQRKGHWSFSKGHREGSETEEETARREILEETGLGVRFLPGFRTMYTYEKKPGVMKTVTFFLAEHTEGTLHTQKEELIDAGWFTAEEALQHITFERDRKVFQEALSALQADRPSG